MKRASQQKSIIPFLKKPCIAQHSKTDVTMFPWLLPDIAKFLPRASCDELRCVSRASYRAMTYVPGLTMWHKRVVTHDVYHAPLKLICLVLDIFKTVQTSRIDIDALPFDVFEFMDFGNLVNSQPRFIDIVLLEQCDKLVNMYYDPSDAPWSLILLFIIEDAKRNGLYHNILADSDITTFTESTESTDFDTEQYGRLCDFCGSGTHRRYIAPRDTFFEFNTRRGMFIVMYVSILLRDRQKIITKRDPQTVITLTPLPHFVIDEIIKKYRFSHHWCRFDEVDFNMVHYDLCSSINPEIIRILNDSGSHISLKNTTDDDVDPTLICIDEDNDVIHNWRDWHDFHSDNEDVAEEISHAIGRFLYERAKRLADSPQILTDYDSFIDFLSE